VLLLELDVLLLELDVLLLELDVLLLEVDELDDELLLDDARAVVNVKLVVSDVPDKLWAATAKVCGPGTRPVRVTGVGEPTVGTLTDPGTPSSTYM
jgi:hypothetical protein